MQIEQSSVSPHQYAVDSNHDESDLNHNAYSLMQYGGGESSASMNYQSNLEHDAGLNHSFQMQHELQYQMNQPEYTNYHLQDFQSEQGIGGSNSTNSYYGPGSQTQDSDHNFQFHSEGTSTKFNSMS